MQRRHHSNDTQGSNYKPTIKDTLHHAKTNAEKKKSSLHAAEPQVERLGFAEETMSFEPERSNVLVAASQQNVLAPQMPIDHVLSFAGKYQKVVAVMLAVGVGSVAYWMNSRLQSIEERQEDIGAHLNNVEATMARHQALHANESAILESLTQMNNETRYQLALIKNERKQQSQQPQKLSQTTQQINSVSQTPHQVPHLIQTHQNIPSTAETQNLTQGEERTLPGKDEKDCEGINAGMLRAQIAGNNNNSGGHDYLYFNDVNVTTQNEIQAASQKILEQRAAAMEQRSGESQAMYWARRARFSKSTEMPETQSLSL